MHGRANAGRNAVRLTREDVIAALDGRRLKDAARVLGCCQQTLRNRFPDLLEPRKRVSPTSIDDPRDLARVLEVATDPRISVHQCAKELRMSTSTVLRICERHGIPWIRKSKKHIKKRMYAAEDWDAVAQTKSTRPAGPVSQKEIEAVLRLADDPAIGILEAVHQTGFSRGAIYRICKNHGVHWRRRNRVPRGYEPTDDETAKILAAAANPNAPMETLLAETGLSQSVVHRVLRQHGLAWTRYSKRPTLRASAIYASPLGPVEP